jgi:hypothetical protein
MENKELETPLVEDLDTAAAPNIATADENLTVEAMFQQSALPSLGRQIFSVVDVHGPTGALFNLRKKAGTTNIELVRADVEVYPSKAITTGLTQEVIEDMRSMYGKEAENVIGKLLRGLANEDENLKTLAFLGAEAASSTDLQLSDSLNAETNLFEITQKVHELVLEMNTQNMRSFEAFAVIPFAPLGSIMGLSKYLGDEESDARGLLIGTVGQTKFFLNPNATSITGTAADAVANFVTSINITAVASSTDLFENATFSLLDDGTDVTSVKSSVDFLDAGGVLVAAAGTELLVTPTALAAGTLTLLNSATITFTGAVTGASGTATFDTTGASEDGNTADTNVYVGLKDTSNPSKSSAVFSPYVSSIVDVQSPDSGASAYHIFNRYAITASPLHVVDNEMLFKFTILT